MRSDSLRMGFRFLRNILPVMALLIGCAAPGAAADTQPLDVLRDDISRGLAILNDRQYETEDGRALQEARIRQLTGTLFDFAAMSRLVLSRHWHAFTPEEQEAFVRAFRNFLQRTYVPVLLDRYRGERVEYVRQVQLSSARVRVEVRVMHRDTAIPVDVKMIHREGRWRVYDVDALGISAVGIYRAQFQALLSRETPGQVIDRLERMPALKIP